MTGHHLLLGVLLLLALWFTVRWRALERRRSAGDASGRATPGAIDLAIGFVTNFFDALGIGSFATTTAAFKLLHRVADDKIPGTLNVGHALPTVLMAVIFISAVDVQFATLAGMITAAVLGAWFGVRIVSRLPRRAIQLGMGAALAVAALLLLARLLHWMPGGGDAHGLQGTALLLAVAVSFALGMLMMLGIGLYAPCLILVSLLGMHPLVAFPIMMGSCAFLMLVGGERFVRAGRYDLRAALGLTLAGLAGVVIAAFIVKSLPIDLLQWLVVIVVSYAAMAMLLSARRTRPADNSAIDTHPVAADRPDPPV